MGPNERFIPYTEKEEESEELVLNFIYLAAAEAAAENNEWNKDKTKMSDYFPTAAVELAHNLPQDGRIRTVNGQISCLFSSWFFQIIFQLANHLFVPRSSSLNLIHANTATRYDVLG